MTSGPPAFRAASPTSYGLSAAGAASAPVQPDYSLPAQRSGSAVPGEPTRARASVPGMNRITPDAPGGAVSGGTSGTGYPRVYRAGSPNGTEPDEKPDPMEPPRPPEPPQPAEPPAPGPGPVPTPFPDPNRPGQPGPHPGPPVPMPPAPPTPPGPPFPSPSPLPPFPPPPAVGTTWTSSSAAHSQVRSGDMPNSTWPVSETGPAGRQWPQRSDANVTPVARGYSTDSPDDPHGVAASAEYNQWARGQRRESGTVYSPPARRDDTSGRGVPVNPAIENTGSLTGHILSPQRWTNNSNSNNSTRVVVIFGGVAAAILVVGIIASIVLGDLVKGLFGQ
ncbi:hypothetical protein ACIA8K_07545 [Catenuloplanes sp. NPDC051500]|uniref:hypothetical protein n=1 Tax=Catenuloplanes sp. NPDC051500 TaxID=3363959 RepID=UPI003798B8F9